MTRDIDWHKRRLQNMNHELFGMKAVALKLKNQISNMRDEIEAYELDIENAEAEGLKEFDREKYGVKKEAGNVNS